MSQLQLKEMRCPSCGGYTIVMKDEGWYYFSCLNEDCNRRDKFETFEVGLKIWQGKKSCTNTASSYKNKQNY